jgi:GNAT superfamily N-acetyltransferase
METAALPPGWSIEPLALPATDADVDGLARVLVDAVESNASVSFMAGLTIAEAAAWWRKTVDSLHARAAFLVAKDPAGAIQGTVHIQPAWAPNQPHRAEVTKLLVHRGARRNGLGEALMAAIEAVAAANGFTLLTLDTASDPAERIYRRRDWTECGRIPDFALNPDGTYCDTVLFWKAVERHPGKR